MLLAFKPASPDEGHESSRAPAGLNGPCAEVVFSALSFCFVVFSSFFTLQQNLLRKVFALTWPEFSFHWKTGRKHFLQNQSVYSRFQVLCSVCSPAASWPVIFICRAAGQMRDYRFQSTWGSKISAYLSKFWTGPGLFYLRHTTHTHTYAYRKKKTHKCTNGANELEQPQRCTRNTQIDALKHLRMYTR